MGFSPRGAQRACGVADDHELFIRAHDADRDGRAVGGNDRSVRVVACRVELNAEAIQATTDALADRGRVLPNPAGEDQRIQSAERRHVCAEKLADLIAENGDRLRRARVGGRSCEQVAHVGARARESEQASTGRDHRIDIVQRHGALAQ